MRKTIGKILLVLGIIVLAVAIVMNLVILSFARENGYGGGGAEFGYYAIIIGGILLTVLGIILIRFDGVKNRVKGAKEEAEIRKKESKQKKEENKRLKDIAKNKNMTDETKAFAPSQNDVIKNMGLDNSLGEYQKHIKLFRHSKLKGINIFRKILGAVMFFGVIISIPFVAKPLFGGASSGGIGLMNMLYLLLLTATFFLGFGLMATSDGANHNAKVTAFAMDEFRQIYYIKYPKSVDEEIPREVRVSHAGRFVEARERKEKFLELEKERSANIARENFEEEVEKAVNNEKADLQGVKVIRLKNPRLKKELMRYAVINYKEDGNDKMQEAVLFKSNDGYKEIIKSLKRYDIM